MVTTIRTSLLRHFGHCGNDGITCLLLAQWICWRLLFPYLIPVNQGGLTAEPWEFRSLSMNWTQKREGCVVGAGFDPGWSTDPGSGSRRLLRELPGYPGYVRRGANQKVADVVPFRLREWGAWILFSVASVTETKGCWGRGEGREPVGRRAGAATTVERRGLRQ